VRVSGIIISTMATGSTNTYDLPYPLLSDPVNVHEDIQSLAERLEDILSNVGVPFISIEVRNNSGVSIPKATPVYITGHSTKPTIAKSRADNLETLPVIGVTQSAIANGADGVIIVSGLFEDVDTSIYTAGDILYLGSTGGLAFDDQGTSPGALVVVLKSNSTTGSMLIFGAPRGNGTWGALKYGYG